jgi:branched-chain amino acid transport system permease protein
MVLEHVLAKAYPTAWQLGIGLLLIAVALFARNGILGVADKLRSRIRGRSAS